MIELPDSTIWTPPNFRVKKYSEVVLPFSGHVGIGGLFRLEAFNTEDGSTRWLTPWFHNNVTNVGLDMCATNGDRYNCCQVGTGNVAPTNTDTTLQTFLASTANGIFISRTNSGSTDYYTEWYCRYDFATGAATGNLSEVGVGPSTSSGSNLFSRELIRDASGNPTTITIASNEALRVHYKLRNYPPLTDVTGTVNGTIDGNAVSRNFTRRAALVAGADQWGPMEANAENTAPGYGSGGSGFGVPSKTEAYTGTIGLITGAPSSSAGKAGSNSASPYSAGTYSRTYTSKWATSQSNANLKSFLFYNGGGYTGFGTANAGAFQVEFDTTLNKTNLQELTLEFLISWGRYTP